jgi:colanic acid biosynthesis glycosyl transferase WcaI
VKLLVLSINYWPEPTGFAPHTTALAEHLVSVGHEVTVLTGFPFAPRWSRWPEYRGAFARREIVKGVRLVRVTHFVPRRPGAAWQRILMEASFCASGAAALSNALLGRRSRPDAVLYVGAQPAIAMLARGVAAVVRAPYFVNVNDLAAQAASDVGIVRTGWARRLLERFEFAAYLSSAGASVLCRSFKTALIARGYPADRIRLIRSPVDLDRVRPLPPSAEYRAALGLPDDAFVVLFAGSMGLKQGLPNVVEAARLLNRRAPSQRSIVWVLVGDGETRQHIESLVDEYRLSGSVRILPLQPEDRLASTLAAADVLLLNQVASVKDTVIPSKLLTYMAAGRPVLAAVNALSQAAEILREADGGILVAPEDPIALVAGVEALASASPDALAGMSRRNRHYAERCFDQRAILAQHEQFMLERMAVARLGEDACRGASGDGESSEAHGSGQS